MTSNFGQAGLSDPNTDFTKIRFAIRQELAKLRTNVPVKIVAVHGGGVGPAPTVDVQPLINQIDGLGNATPHGVIFGIQTTRSQGGTSVVINDPNVGDIGWMSVSDRDLSSLVAAGGAQSNPGSYRRGSLSDGVYTGAMLNQATPTQYIQFTPTGINIVDTNGNKIVTQAGSIAIYACPAPGQFVYLGGTGADGSYDFVQTVSGPSTTVKARFA